MCNKGEMKFVGEVLGGREKQITGCKKCEGVKYYLIC
jgi:hypothetical protein